MSSKYECVVMLRSDLTDQQAEDVNNKNVSKIESFGAEIKYQEYWGLRNLSYKIKKNKKSHYFFWHIEIDGSNLNKVRQMLFYNDSVIRSMIIKLDEFGKTPTMIVAKPKHTEEGEEEEKKVPFIDLIDYKNVYLLKKYTSEKGRIIPRRVSMINLKEQKKLAKAIKRGRILSLIAPLIR